MNKVLIASVPNMIKEKDIEKLKKISQVDFLIKDNISNEDLANMAKNYDYLMLNYDIVTSLNEIFYKSIKNTKLKAISTDITGMAWALPKVAKENDIILMNTPNYCTDSVAEYTITQILVYAKQIHNSYKDLKEDNVLEARKGFNLKGKTIGILGLGNIGTKVAKLALGFEMNVVAYDRKNKNIEGVKQYSIEEVFKQSDIISPHLKCVVGQTEKIINKNLLKLAKPNCFIVNQGGDRLVDFKDLEKALENKTICGYAGTYREENKNLLKYENVILMPANAWFSDESLNNLKEIWVENIISCINGNPNNIVLE